MAASGIDPVNSAKDELAHICDLVDFAIKMSVILGDINQKTGNDFKLRIGKCWRNCSSKKFLPSNERIPF